MFQNYSKNYKFVVFETGSKIVRVILYHIPQESLVFISISKQLANKLKKNDSVKYVNTFNFIFSVNAKQNVISSPWINKFTDSNGWCKNKQRYHY